MEKEALNRANEIVEILGQINSVCIDKFTNDTIKVYLRYSKGDYSNGIYFNKELSTKISGFFESLKNGYEKELEEL